MKMAYNRMKIDRMAVMQPLISNCANARTNFEVQRGEQMRRRNESARGDRTVRSGLKAQSVCECSYKCVHVCVLTLSI